MSACACDAPGLRPVDVAIADLLAQRPALPAMETLPLAQAAGRTLAQAVVASRAMPAWDNSAMDGYALRAADVPAGGGYLPLAGRVAAGDSGETAVPAGHAVRIFTGAPLPPGTDTVVAQEQAQAQGEGVLLPACVAGSHVRRRGEEFAAGAQVLAAGQHLRAAELGLLASLGQASVAVYKRLRVGLLSSGNELREPGETLAPGQIYDANHYSLQTALQGWGLEVGRCGVLADRLQDTRAALQQAAQEWDVLISSGGVSVGAEDHLKQAVRDLGELQLWRLAIQPGKPFAFGKVGATPWIGLPGNPVAALLTALVVARPFLLAAQGRRDVMPRQLSVPAGFAWPRANARRQYLRARLENVQGELRLLPYAQQGSAMLSSLCWAEGLAVVEAGRIVAEGECVGFIALNDLLT